MASALELEMFACFVFAFVHEGLASPQWEEEQFNEFKTNNVGYNPFHTNSGNIPFIDLRAALLFIFT